MIDKEDIFGLFSMYPKWKIFLPDNDITTIMKSHVESRKPKSGKPPDLNRYQSVAECSTRRLLATSLFSALLAHPVLPAKSYLVLRNAYPGDRNLCEEMR